MGGTHAPFNQQPNERIPRDPRSRLHSDAQCGVAILSLSLCVIRNRSSNMTRSFSHLFGSQLNGFQQQLCMFSCWCADRLPCGIWNMEYGFHKLTSTS
ncbi:hypothetical protein I7I50_00307 [Histoplasma capsulatum G186AR]|uniref:Uncharacterized protein n=1 Tax=Ajellomyces capsulatus TaxID=5037 RepID=A0A8H8CUN8_AJECA|nr:hypothetical protein I7I52_07575 [Histoplasma capsulatum]QSS72453.1 hypothetical protein I7I50_00307 [Histoplasma capsulatum G186AR]